MAVATPYHDERHQADFMRVASVRAGQTIDAALLLCFEAVAPSSTSGVLIGHDAAYGARASPKDQLHDHGLFSLAEKPDDTESHRMLRCTERQLC